MLKLIENKIEKTQKNTNQQQYSKSCLFCKFAERPREDLPHLCLKLNAIGFAKPWDMPILNCEYFVKRKE